MTDPSRSAAVEPDWIKPFLQPGAQLGLRAFDGLVAKGEVLQRKYFGQLSVVRCERDHAAPLIIKLWYRKYRWSSDRLFPYSGRFRKNSARLRALGVSAPAVIGWGRVEPGHVRFVSYQALQGEILSTALERVDLDATASFVASLHDLGVDFRALHLGNILRNEAGDFSLIDVTDCRFKGGSLALRLRARRLARFCHHGPERVWFAEGRRWSAFAMAYCRSAGLSLADTAVVHDAVRARFES